MPDLRIGGELEVTHDYLVARPVEPERARERVEAGRSRGRDRNLPGTGTQHGSHGAAHGLVLFDPYVPVRAHLQTVFHVGVDRIAYAVGQGAVRAAVEIGLARQYREAPTQGHEVRHEPGPSSAGRPGTARARARHMK